MKNKYTVGNLIYDAGIYDGMNTNMDDLQFYKKWMPEDTNARILEVCCGTGRLTIPIAKDGHHITGVDYTKSMLEEARSKAADADVNIEFIEADMRTLALHKTYDLIFIPFNSVHHLYTNDDLFRTLTAVQQHLRKDGLLLFDCFMPNIQFITEGEKALKEVSTYTTKDGREVVIKEIMRYENSTQINRIEWHYFINGAFDSVQNLDMRMFFPQELDSYLQQHNFEIVHKFGSFEEDAFTDASQKQIFVCRSKSIQQ
ncbi:MAG: class I SAM-dependent methyltransferase [Bacteroidota bacterium]